MSRFLAAFRASLGEDAKAVFSAAYGCDNPEKGENSAQTGAGCAAETGFRGFRDCGNHTSGKTAFLTAARAAAEALRVPDPDLARERAEIASALTAEATGAFGPSIAPERHRQAVAGLLRGFAGHPRHFGEGTQP